MAGIPELELRGPSPVIYSRAKESLQRMQSLYNHYKTPFENKAFKTYIIYQNNLDVCIRLAVRLICRTDVKINH